MDNNLQNDAMEESGMSGGGQTALYESHVAEGMPIR